MNSDPDQMRELILLEKMKVKILEDNLKQKEEQLNTNEKLFEDFRTK